MNTTYTTVPYTTVQPERYDFFELEYGLIWTKRLSCTLSCLKFIEGLSHSYGTRVHIRRG